MFDSLYIPSLGGMSNPSQGVVWHVKPGTGSDGNDGLTPDTALKTLTRAKQLAFANRNDVVKLYSESNTASATTDYQTATLAWDKNLLHLVGVNSGSFVSQRSRVANASASVLSPLVTVSASGCYFRDLQFYHGIADATALVDVNVTGQRNRFDNVHFAGVADATQSAAGACSLKIDGGAENVFSNCVIGVDTSTYDADATGVLFDTAATRNKFEGCLFQGYISAAGFASITVADSTGIDRWQIFKNCLFLTESTNKGVTQTSVFSIPAISQGKIILMDCMAVSDGGAVDWDSNNRGIIWNNTPAAAASGAGGIGTNQ